MPTCVLTADALKPHLQRCGYVDAQIEADYRFDSGRVPLAAFSSTPFDTRSACINVVEPQGSVEASVASVRNTGAPVVFACSDDRLEWWKQQTGKPQRIESLKASQVGTFFSSHNRDFAPNTIYEAKTRFRLPGQKQLRFVDIGLMPMVERAIGDDLSHLVVRVIAGMESTLRKKIEHEKDADDAFKSVFWLLAAKILRDKEVSNFKTIKLTDIDDVFRRVGRHYGDTQGLPPRGRRWRPAIEEATETVDAFGHLGSVSTEALAYLYENTLVPKTVRKNLGIHSTPSCLVDYMVWQLWPWIEEIPEQNRYVFEPACGHSAFLVGAMRLLRQWSSITEAHQRHDYLKRHLRGVEIDNFAWEIARLSLTLADVPHGNSWNLTKADMFDGDLLEKGARGCRILLANPPFEKFSRAEKTAYGRRGVSISSQTKAVEMLRRTIPQLPRGTVFGVVVPQGTLHSPEATEVRELLVRDFEIAEIDLFADNLFETSDHETAVILGRRGKPSAVTPMIKYRRVREKGMDGFRERLAFSSQQPVALAELQGRRDADLRVPELYELWRYLSDRPTLDDIASLGQGLAFKGQGLPAGAWTVREKPKPGDLMGYAKIPRNLMVYGRPPKVGINLDRSVLLHVRTGLPTGERQVLINYAPVSRDPWKLKAFIDDEGLAVTSRFITVRPRQPECSIEYLWALLNSPVANAFAHCHTLKRDILVGTIRRLPLPLSAKRSIAVLQAAREYLSVARETDEFMEVGPSEDSVKRALFRMDAEVLRLYDLPPRLEWQLLDLFEGMERKGVACEFRGYYPEGLDAYVPLHELISDEYQRSTLDAFLRRHKPTDSPEVLAALRRAAEAYAEE